MHESGRDNVPTVSKCTSLSAPGRLLRPLPGHVSTARGREGASQARGVRAGLERLHVGTQAAAAQGRHGSNSVSTPTTGRVQHRHVQYLGHRECGQKFCLQFVLNIMLLVQEWSIQGLEPAAGRGVYPANRRNIALAKEFIERMEASGGTEK